MSAHDTHTYTCPLCGSTNTKSYFGSDDRLQKCTVCDVGFLDPALWITELDSYYETNPAYAQNGLDTRKVEVMRHGADALLTIMNKYVRAGSDKKLLDVGSNYGVFLEEAQKRGYVVEGIEMNTSLVREAQSRSLPVSHGGAMDISNTKQHDVITLIHVLEHIPEVREVVRKIHGALADDGFFFVEVHNIDSYIARKHKESWKYVSLEHLYYFTPRTLTKLLQDEGFSVVDVITRNHYLETFSIKYLFQHLFATPFHSDRFFKKGDMPIPPAVEMPQEKDGIRSRIRSVLIFLITLFSREDLMLLVAQKRRN
jgi:2-polyprenyl-3-methyl-5-hydroxy-6-metoxy-1,4-benzoquinol methylase